MLCEKKLIVTMTKKQINFCQLYLAHCSPSSLVKEVFCFVDFCSKIWRASFVWVIKKHNFLVVFTDFFHWCVRRNAKDKGRFSLIHFLLKSSSVVFRVGPSTAASGIVEIRNDIDLRCDCFLPIQFCGHGFDGFFHVFNRSRHGSKSNATCQSNCSQSQSGENYAGRHCLIRNVRFFTVFKGFSIFSLLFSTFLFVFLLTFIYFFQRCEIHREETSKKIKKKAAQRLKRSWT